MTSKISVITINYNDSVGLERTFKSIFKQTFKDFEYIVIDGGSNDGSKALIENNASQINYWVSEKDKGIYNAMNKGIIAAKGEYLIFINSGDELFEENTLEKCAPFLNSADIISGNLQFIDGDEKKILNTPEIITFKTFMEGTLFHPSTFIKKEAFLKTELYDENFKITSDWKWFLLAFYKYAVDYKSLDVTVAKFYMDGISSSKEMRQVIKKEGLETLQQYFPRLYPEYELIMKRQKLLEGYESSRIIAMLKKIGFFKALK